MAATLTVAAGCDDRGIVLTHVRGAATFQGQPLTYGVIEFVPDVSRGAKGPAGQAEIIDGRFTTKSPGGRGVIDGPHLVRITGYSDRPVDSADETAPVTAVKPMFAAYSIPVESLAEEADFDVPDSTKGFGVGK